MASLPPIQPKARLHAALRLTQSLVVRLNIGERSMSALKEGAFEANPGLKPHIVFDEHGHALPGFGARVHFGEVSPQGEQWKVLVQSVAQDALPVRLKG